MKTRKIITLNHYPSKQTYGFQTHCGHSVLQNYMFCSVLAPEHGVCEYIKYALRCACYGTLRII